MGTISDKLTYLNTTKTKIRKGLNSLGADLDTEDTFRSYADAIDGIYEDYPKITGEGESLSLDNTKQASMQIDYKGNTSQNGTPTPSSPIPINVVSGDNTIDIVGKNLAQHKSGYIVPSTGVFKASNDDCFYFPVVEGETYYCKSTGNRTIGAIYTSIPVAEQTCIQGTNINNVPKNGSFVASATGIMVVYANTPTSQSVIDTFMVTKGSTAPTTYEPYIGNSYHVNLRAYLPSEYTPVEYIESSSTQYIDTGFKPNQDTRVVLDYIDNFTQASFILGARSSNASNQYAITDLDTNDIRSDYNSNQQNLSRTIGIRYVLDKNKNKTYLYQNGNLVASNSINYNNFTPNINMYLFNINNNGSVGSPGAKIRLYSCKIYDNGILVRNFVPCYRNSDSVIGLYDTQNGGFYTNQGTGTFTKGNDIPNGIELCKIGTYEDYIRKSTGINLFNPDDLVTGIFILTATGQESNNSVWTQTKLINIGDVGSMTSSNSVLASGGGRFEMSQYDENKNWIKSSQYGNSNAYSSTVYLEANTRYIRFGFRNDEGFTNIMLQTGSTSLPYEPYGKVWYLHKEIGKVILNGSENWTQFTSATLTNTILCGTNIIDNIPRVAYIGLSNYFKSNPSSIWNVDIEAITIADTGTDAIRIRINKNVVSDASALETWLSTHNTIVYYVLATSTNTLIEDTTLIEQLEESKLSYISQTNISQVNNDLPFILDVKALRGE